MHSDDNQIWVFASALFAIFLLCFSGLTIHFTDPKAEIGENHRFSDEQAPPLNTLVAAPPRRLFDREFLASAYSDYGITKSGVLVANGIVAADPKVLPIGSIIEIDAGSYSGIYTVMDTGSAVKGERIDIFIPSYDEAMRFGTRRVAVKVIRRGWNPNNALATAG